jgi:hypothetical protein
VNAALALVHPEQRRCHASQLFSTGDFRIFSFGFCETTLQNSKIATRTFGASGRK